MEQKDFVNAKNKVAWYNKGLALHFDDYENAIECYNQAIKLDPNFKDAFAMKGAALANNERYLEAIECYDQMLRLDPHNTDLLSRKADALRLINKFSEAIECYEKIFILDPKNLMYINITNSFCELGQAGDAVKACDKFILHTPENSFVYTTKARIQSDSLARFNDALISLEKALFLLEKNNSELISINDKPPISTTHMRTAELLIAKAQSLTAMGRYQEAQKCCDKALALADKFEEVRNKKAIILHLKCFILKFMRNYKEASVCIDLFNQIPEAESIKQYLLPSVISEKGLLLLLESKTNILIAEELFDEALAKNNKAIPALIGNGLAALLKQKDAVAQNYFTQAEQSVKNLREKLELYHNIGHHSATLGLYEQASAYLERAVRLKSDYLPALTVLKQLPTVKNDVPATVKTVSNKHETSLQQARSHVDLEEYEEALDIIDSILKDDAINIGAIVIKGKILEAQDKPEDAKFEYKTAVRLFKQGQEGHYENDLKIAQKRLEKLEVSKQTTTPVKLVASKKPAPASLNLAPSIASKQVIKPAPVTLNLSPSIASKQLAIQPTLFKPEPKLKHAPQQATQASGSNRYQKPS